MTELEFDRVQIFYTPLYLAKTFVDTLEEKELLELAESFMLNRKQNTWYLTAMPIPYPNDTTTYLVQAVDKDNRIIPISSMVLSKEYFIKLFSLKKEF
ncbi:hypothetical protein [Bacillus paranthracis]|uniref:hypothetical protein n=1 Tax=Bacillus paranthracis TaxID=2026186 RepID=UPI002FDC09C8|nr:hypothetical protein [Bacillus paranthracis]